jgi:sterol desaturase/sphingolipid hydroxylase (fatty acid hydroxylase superfamily)
MGHACHHHLSHSGNFGVTTAFWDHVFGTVEARVPKFGRAK